MFLLCYSDGRYVSEVMLYLRAKDVHLSHKWWQVCVATEVLRSTKIKKLMMFDCISRTRYHTEHTANKLLTLPCS